MVTRRKTTGMTQNKVGKERRKLDAAEEFNK
jgi:hypothetical protein